MGIVSFPLDHQYCKSSSSSSQTPIAINNNIVSGAMKIQIPSSSKEFKAGNDEDNPETPRSMEHRIPVIATCPPAPRKAKRVSTTRKRRAWCFPVVRVHADFVVYIDAMLALNETVYVPDIVVGDLGAGDHHAKKIKLLSPPAYEL